VLNGFVATGRGFGHAASAMLDGTRFDHPTSNGRPYVADMRVAYP